MLIDLSIDLCICLFIDLSSYLFSDLVIFLSPDQSGALSIYWSILLLIHCSIDVSNFLFHRSSFVIINSSINLPIASSICRSIYRMMTHDTHIHSDTYMYVFSIGTSSFDINKEQFPLFRQWTFGLIGTIWLGIGLFCSIHRTHIWLENGESYSIKTIYWNVHA